MHFPKPSRAILVCMSIYALLLAFEAAVNIRINYLGKGSTWDIYPFAEAFWVLCSVLVVAFCTSARRLAMAIVALLFLDSFVDVCAMGTRCWWSGPPLLVEWKWVMRALSDAHRLDQLMYAYWICTWGMQVPLRCFAIAWAAGGGWGRRFLIISLGLNLIWFTAPQDVLYFVVWTGPFVRRLDLSYLPPAGFWNVWNMLLLRVPIGVGVGALLVRAGLGDKRNWVTNMLIACGLLAIAAYVVMCGLILLSGLIGGR